MVLREDQAKVKALLTEAITVLCKNGLSYRAEFSVEGLLGITLDNEEVFLISINELIRGDGQQMGSPNAHVQTPRKSPMIPPNRGRGRGGHSMGGRGRASVPQARKRSMDGDFKNSGSTPGTPTHPIPSPHSSMGSPPGTPGTPQQQHMPGQPDNSDQPPMKRFANDDGAQDGNDLEDGPKIKSEPGTMPTGDDTGNWDSAQPNDPNNGAMQMPSFGDELNLGGAAMDPMNVKMENAGQGLPHHQPPTGAGPGMFGNATTVSDYFKTDLFHCTNCEKTFRTRQGLSRHMEHHTGNYKWWCESCRKGFIGHTAYKNHMMKHAGTCFFCDECQQVYKSQQTYNKHMKQSHGTSGGPL